MNKFLAIPLLLCAATLYAAIPEQINYQGMLTDTAGTPLDSTHDLTFRLWLTPAGGTPLWTELHDDVIITDGLFDVILGYYNPLDSILFDEPYYLGVQVDNDTEMIPRKPFSSVAYSLNSKSSESGGGYAPIAKDTITSTGVLGSSTWSTFSTATLILNCPAAGRIIVNGTVYIESEDDVVDVCADTSTSTTTPTNEAYYTHYANEDQSIYYTGIIEQHLSIHRTFRINAAGTYTIRLKARHSNGNLNFIGPASFSAVWYPN